MFRRRGLALRLLLLGLLIIPSFGLLLSSEASAQAARKLKLNRVEANNWPEVTINMTLTGPDGKAVPDVQPTQFEVREQDQPQTLLGLELGPAKSVPLALVLAMDISGSMNADSKLGQAKAAASAFISSLRQEDSASLVAFNDQVRTIVPATNNVGTLQAGINDLQAGGNTAIYDAVYRSAQTLNPVPASKRRAIVLLTDGVDTSSHYSARVAADIAKQTGALLYTIGLGPDANDAVLTLLSEPSGGKYYKAPSAADLNAIYTAISIELDAQLFLKYKSSTHIERTYELVHLEVKYTAPDGQVIVGILTYRPRGVAAAPPEPSTGATVPNPQPFVVGLPSGIARAQQAAAPAASVPVTFRMFSLGAAILASIAALFGTIGLAAVLAPSLTSQRVARYVGGDPAIPREDRPPGFIARVLLPFIETVGKRLTRFSPKGYTDHVDHLLTLTGPPYRMRLGGFLGLQMALSTVFVVLLVLWALKTSPETPSQWLLAALVGLGVGGYLPYFWLKRRVTRRQKALLRALPGALDFLAINVEAGLGFDAAISQVVQRWRNTLTDEFALLLIDFQIGKARKDAWRDLMLRTQVPELNTFVTAMLQNEQVGSSIGLLLRTQADQMRIRRRQAAEEAARTAPVKMLLPMVFFIFPGIFVVILGPAVPQFLNTFTQLAK